jgi:hypothetical protein
LIEYLLTIASFYSLLIITLRHLAIIHIIIISLIIIIDIIDAINIDIDITPLMPLRHYWYWYYAIIDYWLHYFIIDIIDYADWYAIIYYDTLRHYHYAIILILHYDIIFHYAIIDWLRHYWWHYYYAIIIIFTLIIDYYIYRWLRQRHIFRHWYDDIIPLADYWHYWHYAIEPLHYAIAIITPLRHIIADITLRHYWCIWYIDIIIAITPLIRHYYLILHYWLFSIAIDYYADISLIDTPLLIIDYISHYYWLIIIDYWHYAIPLLAIDYAMPLFSLADITPADSHYWYAELHYDSAAIDRLRHY